jgi:hypothetical protein
MVMRKVNLRGQQSQVLLQGQKIAGREKRTVPLFFGRQMLGQKSQVLLQGHHPQIKLAADWPTPQIRR